MPARPSGPFLTMTQPRRAACCLFTHDDAPESLAPRLESLLRHTPPDAIELRLGFRRATYNLHYALGLLCPDGSTPTRHELPGGVERFQWTAATGLPVRAWHAPRGLPRNALARLLYHDVPLDSDYAITLEDCHVEAGWWEALDPLLKQGIDYLGQPHWLDYTPRQMEYLQMHPGYLSVPFARRDGRPGVSYLAGAFLALRSGRLHEANYPEPPAPGEAALPALLSAEALLGEIAHQHGWAQAAHAEHLQRKP